MQSRGETHAWRWSREPSSLTQVCIVMDGSVADSFAQALLARTGDSPQVALLRLTDPAAAHAEWLASRESSQGRARRAENALEQTIDRLPRDSRLLLCCQDVAALEWLGGVIGQRVFFAQYRPGVDEELHLTAMTRSVEDALRASLTEKWGDSY
ncbi:1-aminocyclopropane-1-carboxylate deaminase [Paraburkholderia sp. J7]|uniref:1-aminocyclopropane-1-carboxylate deaminase n=1 Tax=Paraburkholderia sp. J7 TaxID=2805438 RepID=UPI002AB7D431|nr:1-aminocyclopropane-1-carboxylate deaminase [Paraburkholderia sp. J7]